MGFIGNEYTNGDNTILSYDWKIYVWYIEIGKHWKQRKTLACCAHIVDLLLTYIQICIEIDAITTLSICANANAKIFTNIFTVYRYVFTTRILQIIIINWLSF